MIRLFVHSADRILLAGAGEGGGVEGRWRGRRGRRGRGGGGGSEGESQREGERYSRRNESSAY